MGRRDVCSSAPTLLPEDERGREAEGRAWVSNHAWNNVPMPSWHGMGHGGSPPRGVPRMCDGTPRRAVERVTERVMRCVIVIHSRTLRILLGVMMNWNRNCFR